MNNNEQQDDNEQQNNNEQQATPPDESLGRAANRYVSFQIASSVIGGIIFLIMLFTVILPGMNRVNQGMDRANQGMNHGFWQPGPSAR